jgi:DDE superfamily endonuclease
MTLEGMGPSLAVEGATNTTKVFETYVERVLAPTLREGQVMVMDNLSAHKAERVRELIEGRGCELIYLPPYSPDIEPHLRRLSEDKGPLAQSRSSKPRSPALEAIGTAISALTAQDARGFFEHCGYRALIQMF